VKLITFFLAPAKLEAVKSALWQQGVRAFSISDAQGLGLQRGPLSREEDFVSALQPRVRLEAACRDAEADGLVAAMVEAARTGRVGDGKIFITELAGVVRVRTGERDDAAL
jgi:nitrogen regulatory protein P-II 1